MFTKIQQFYLQLQLYTTYVEHHSQSVPMLLNRPSITWLSVYTYHGELLYYIWLLSFRTIIINRTLLIDWLLEARRLDMTVMTFIDTSRMCKQIYLRCSKTQSWVSILNAIVFYASRTIHVYLNTKDVQLVLS